MSEVPAAGRGTGFLRPYLEREALAAFFVGVSSGFPYAMIGATLTTRLAQDGIDKKTVTAFTLAFLAYNLKVLWAWVVDGVRIPLLGRLGQRVSWMLLSGAAVIAAVVNLALVDPAADIEATVIAALLVAPRRDLSIQPHCLGGVAALTGIVSFVHHGPQVRSCAFDHFAAVQSRGR